MIDLGIIVDNLESIKDRLNDFEYDVNQQSFITEDLE